jgi:hypothetical protein
MRAIHGRDVHGVTLDDDPARMTVLRAGYFNGIYARPGDVIDVPASLVDTLTLDHFAAVVQADEAPPRRPKR